MKQICLVVALLTLAFAAHTEHGLAPAAQAPTDPLPSGCNPFGDLATPRPIDSFCGLQGDPAGTSGQHAQNRVKDNLCAYQTADPATITRFTFDQLQANTPSKASLPWGARDTIPSSDT